MQLCLICELLPPPGCHIILEKYMHNTLHCSRGEICILFQRSPLPPSTIIPFLKMYYVLLCRQFLKYQKRAQSHQFETISCKLAARCLFTPLMPPFEGEFDANEENVVAKAIGAQKHLHKQRISPRNPFIFVQGTHYIF